MSDSYQVSLQTLALCGLGAMTAFSAYKMYSMTSAMEQQNQRMIEMQQKAQEENEKHRKEQELLQQMLEQQRQANNNNNKNSGLNETLSSLVMMQMSKLMKKESENEGVNPSRSKGNSFDAVSDDQQQQRRPNAISEKLMRQMMNSNSIGSLKRNRRLSEDRVDVTRILLTGGPCAGKTTAMAAISQDLTQLGYKVLIVPEAATILMKGGAMIVSGAFTEAEGLLFQKILMKLQMALEECFVEIGQMVRSNDVVILIDRGLLDGSAYVSKENWQALLDDTGCNLVTLRDNRYDAVLHMVTAADGASEFYAALNNEARYESIDEAIEKDKKLREAYIGHQKWFMVGNTAGQDFNGKINVAKQHIATFLGHRVGSSFFQKHLLIKETPVQGSNTKVPINFVHGQHYEESQVIETWINYSSNEGNVVHSSVEKKGSNKAFTYVHKISMIKNGQKLQKKRQISAGEYIQLEQNRRDDMKALEYARICTITDDGLYMIIDYYYQLDGEPMTCIIQVNKDIHQASQIGRIALPKYLHIFREITDEATYNQMNMAKIGFEMPEDDKNKTLTQGVVNNQQKEENKYEEEQK